MCPSPSFCSKTCLFVTGHIFASITWRHEQLPNLYWRRTYTTANKKYTVSTCTTCTFSFVTGLIIASAKLPSEFVKHPMSFQFTMTSWLPGKTVRPCCAVESLYNVPCRPWRPDGAPVHFLCKKLSWRHQLLLCCRVSTDVATPAIKPHRAPSIVTSYRGEWTTKQL